MAIICDNKAQICLHLQGPGFRFTRRQLRVGHTSKEQQALREHPIVDEKEVKGTVEFLGVRNVCFDRCAPMIDFSLFLPTEARYCPLCLPGQYSLTTFSIRLKCQPEMRIVLLPQTTIGLAEAGLATVLVRHERLRVIEQRRADVLQSIAKAYGLSPVALTDEMRLHCVSRLGEPDTRRDLTARKLVIPGRENPIRLWPGIAIRKSKNKSSNG